MLFSSVTFLYLFLPCVLIGYYVILRKCRPAQNGFLLLASLIFYAWGEPRFVLVMGLSIVSNWFFGWLIWKKQEKHSLCKLLLTLDMVLNLGLLFICKYLNFTAHILEGITGIALGIPRITLPIGISFFTFQAMSYVVDVYRSKAPAQRNPLNVGLYIAFFPQLIAGPIVRYETIAREITDRKETLDDFADGFARFVVGLSKKILLANSFAFLADRAFLALKDGTTFSVAFSWLGIIAYALQIFFDFGGYSDMAIGLGSMFGFHFPENFNYPYISTSISEFWRRWHISLGSWFRDYLYIPLGGSRVSKPRLLWNLFITWLCTGIWHGANFTFLIWGLMYFALIALEKFSGLDKASGKRLPLLKRCYTLFFVLVGWVFFRADSVGDACRYLGAMFGLHGNPLCDAIFLSWLSQYGVLLFPGLLLCTPVFRTLQKKTSHLPAAGYLYCTWLILMLVLCAAALVGNSYNPFIYFKF